jgi:hypothetical protein
MLLPKKENPRKYTVATKVNKDTYLALKQLANEETNGNLSKWLAEYLQNNSEVKYYPELDDPKFVENLYTNADT